MASTSWALRPFMEARAVSILRSSFDRPSFIPEWSRIAEAESFLSEVDVLLLPQDAKVKVAAVNSRKADFMMIEVLRFGIGVVLLLSLYCLLPNYPPVCSLPRCPCFVALPLLPGCCQNCR